MKKFNIMITLLIIIALSTFTSSLADNLTQNSSSYQPSADINKPEKQENVEKMVELQEELEELKTEFQEDIEKLKKYTQENIKELEQKSSELLRSGQVKEQYIHNFRANLDTLKQNLRDMLHKQKAFNYFSATPEPIPGPITPSLVDMPSQVINRPELMAERSFGAIPPEGMGGYAGGVGGYGGAGGGYGGAMAGILPDDNYTQPDKCIAVIPSSTMTSEEISKTMEDMTIMARIFDKKIGQPPLRAAYDRFLTQPYIVRTGSRAAVQNNRATEGIYIAGYGALFLMNVDFPLKEPPQIKEIEEKDTVDTTWEQAKQEISSQQQGVPIMTPGTLPPNVKYDSEKVAELKDKVIKTLKHASNIKTLKPDEFITVSITGASNQPGNIQVKRYLEFMQESKVARVIEDNRPTGRPTFLTIRVKKSSLDLFSQGKVDYNEFYSNLELISH